MSKEAFKIHKPHKMLDWIESQVTDWAYDLVNSHYDVLPEHLSREEIEEVISQYEELVETNGYDFLALGLRNVISNWENENDEYLL